MSIPYYYPIYYIKRIRIKSITLKDLSPFFSYQYNNNYSSKNLLQNYPIISNHLENIRRPNLLSNTRRKLSLTISHNDHHLLHKHPLTPSLNFHFQVSFGCRSPGRSHFAGVCARFLPIR